MDDKLRLDKSLIQLLRCPICKSELELTSDGQFICVNRNCLKVFPIVDGVPILINEDNSVFRIQDFVRKRDTYFALNANQEQSSSNLIRRIKNRVNRFLPGIEKNIKATKNYTKLADLLVGDNPNPKILIIGGSIIGDGLEVIISHPSFRFVETDISFGPRTVLICDAHDIPFADGAFDGVIAQAVLEHVVNPYRCVNEIYRVLRDSGLVYAETPFMQQVHGGNYDFTRFTYVGHRRLFRRFSEVDSGAACGPGAALAWSYKYFLQSFATSSLARAFVRYLVHFTVFWLKYFDYYLIDKPEALDAASGYYFLGRKSDQILEDRYLVQNYRCPRG